jgi:hypothetical protein
MDIDQEINALRTEYTNAGLARREEITLRLNQLGTVVYPLGTPEYDEYSNRMRIALADQEQLDALLFPGRTQ